ncbi:MAG: DUF805 domain-containing protein [Caulobacteraceae bacterium]|nr:DUF805 domain-containing protein [Caulobacteraceae bacterium]
MNGGFIDWRELFLSPGGRSPRGPFWIAVAALFALSAVYEAVAGPTLRLLTFWFVYPALLASSACVLSKRLHDRGRSGWWAMPILIALAMIWPDPRGARAVLALPVMIWAAIELGVMAGEQGANRFGPSPLKPAPIQPIR